MQVRLRLAEEVGGGESGVEEGEKEHVRIQNGSCSIFMKCKAGTEVGRWRGE